jgi:L-lactate utilization protein LutC
VGVATRLGHSTGTNAPSLYRSISSFHAGPCGLGRAQRGHRIISLASLRVDDPPLTTPQLDKVDAAITGCAVAISESGTIVLDAGAQQGRRILSLLPDHLIIVINEEQIVERVPDGVARLNPLTAQTWISGPSATSDIELERIEGVHGPRVLDVVIVRG